MKSSKELYYEAIARVDMALNGGRGSGNWGHGGRPGKIGGSGKGISSKIIKPNVMKGMFESAKENGGFTMSIGGNVPKEGLMFAPSKTSEKVFGNKDFTRRKLATYIAKHKSELNQKDMYVGGWFNTDDNKWYLDVSKKGDYSPASIEGAQKAKQLAVFDLKTFNEITVGKEQNGQYRPEASPEAIFNKHFGK